jgi:transcriptional regulator with XRE-family HTH domain
MAVINQSEYLKLKIKEKGFTMTKIAKILNMTIGAFSLKVNGKRHFKNYEVKKLLEILSLSYEELFQTEKLELEVDHKINVVIDGEIFRLDENTKDDVIDCINNKLKEHVKKEVS